MHQVNMTVDGDIRFDDIPEGVSVIVTDWNRRLEYAVSREGEQVVKHVVARQCKLLPDRVMCLRCAFRSGMIRQTLDDWLENWIVCDAACMECKNNDDAIRPSSLCRLIKAALYLRMLRSGHQALAQFLRSFFCSDDIALGADRYRNDAIYELGYFEQHAIQDLMRELDVFDKYLLARYIVCCFQPQSEARLDVLYYTVVCRIEGQGQDYYLLIATVKDDRYDSGLGFVAALYNEGDNEILFIPHDEVDEETLSADEEDRLTDALGWIMQFAQILPPLTSSPNIAPEDLQEYIATHKRS